MQSMNPAEEGAGFRSRAVAAALAMFAGTLGAHHFYLGRRFWWVYPLIAMPLLGIALRFDEWYRQWPFFIAALVTVVSLGEAIRIALIPDESWDARFNADSAVRSHNGVGVVLVAIFSLLLATLIGMSVLALMFEGIFTPA
ncbi:MAG: NINE protein [Burkholderiaceae bacterium]|jgi:hypothetical protein|nr:NINE protein [Burkholderiaceae bacterium]MEB2317911.1 NINE protein [Pseudomonadota bacterium]